MDTLTARPKMLKQANLSSIRSIIKDKKTVTRAELAALTGISSTTVRTLLTEMLESGEIESIGYDASSGGRKAERYCFKSGYCYGVAFCITGNQIHSLLIDIYGEIVETSRLQWHGTDLETAILPFLDNMTTRKNIKVIGLGVPGIVDGGSYWQEADDGTGLYRICIGDTIAERYHLPVIMENDLNAVTLGVDRCYHHQYPAENQENSTLAYVHFEKNCVSAGFVSGGKLIRGCRNYAGELGLMPLAQGSFLIDKLSGSVDDSSYVDQVITILTWICAILNPQYIALAGPALRQHCIGPISDGLYALLPDPMLAEILYTPDIWHDYYNGMAYLTAGKIFDAIQLIKE